jgi:Ulp1 family protease
MLEYLKREWEARNGPVEAVHPLIDLQIKHPMQTNESDCGLFVLEFAERCLSERDQLHQAAHPNDQSTAQIGSSPTKLRPSDSS